MQFNEILHRVYGSDGQNQIAIRFTRDLNRVDDWIESLWDSIQLVCNSILIRFRIFQFNSKIKRFGFKSPVAGSHTRELAARDHATSDGQNQIAAAMHGLCVIPVTVVLFPSLRSSPCL